MTTALDNALHQENLDVDLSRFCEIVATLDGALSGADTVDLVDGIMCSFVNSPVVKRIVRQCEENTRTKRLVKELIVRCGSGIYDRARLLKHAIDKPYGYSGDFNILEHIYDRSCFVESASGPGEALDQWALTSTLPVAVRSRKNILRNVLDQEICNGRTRILSVASGGFRELRELPESVVSRATVDLLDNDQSGFDFMQSKCQPSFFEKVQFIKDDALNINSSLGVYDIVYSFGLYDYLPDKYLDRSIRGVIGSMERDGLFIFCLKDHRYYSPWFYDMFCDWRFVSRVREDGFKIAKRNGLEIVGEYMTEGNTICVYVCKKSK